MTSMFTYRSARRGATTLGLAALVAGLSGIAGAAGASAAPAPLGGAAHLSGAFADPATVTMTNGTRTQTGLIGLTVDADGREIATYCIENHIQTDDTATYYPWSWNDYTSATKGWAGNKGKVMWVLLHSAPHLGTAEVLDAAGVDSTGDPAADRRTVVAATQAAIWHLTDGLDLSSAHASDGVVALYTYFLDHAEDMGPSGPNASLEFTAPATPGVAGGLAGPITLKGTSSATVNATLPDGRDLPAGFEVFTDAAGTRKATDGATYAPGTSFYVSVPAGTADGRVAFHAAGEQTIPVGSVWDSTANGVRTQALITAQESEAHLSAEGAVAWTGAPTTPDTPVPTPGTPTTEPSTPSAPAPATSTPAPTTTPNTPAPVVTTPTTPAPVVTAPAPKPAPTKPTAPVKPGKPVSPSTPALVTRTFQVDRYLPRTAAQAATVARLDDDGRLGYREDRALWGASRHQFVTVTVPVNATKAQVVAAIDAKTNAAVGDVTTLAKLRSASAGRGYTIAWELGRGATPQLAWGANKNIAQTFFARS